MTKYPNCSIIIFLGRQRRPIVDALEFLLGFSLVSYRFFGYSRYYESNFS